VPKLRNQGLLVELMKTWDYSVRALATQAGASKSAIGNLASGARDTCTLEVAKAVSKELQVPLSTLFAMPVSSSFAEQHEALVDTAWVAERLGMTTEWVRDQAEAGRLPAGRIGREFKFRPSDIARFEEQAFARSGPRKQLAATA
jgi:transcriptional regulator with XRE-family HTH domain